MRGVLAEHMVDQLIHRYTVRYTLPADTPAHLRWSAQLVLPAPAAARYRIVPSNDLKLTFM